MTTEDRKDLARLIYQQAQSIATDVAQRAIGNRLLTDVALVDIRRQLDHMIRSIDGREDQSQ